MKNFIGFLVLSSLGIGGCGDSQRVVNPAFAMLDTPAKEGSGETHLAVAPDGRVVLSWLEPDGDGHTLRFSTLAGLDWSPPHTVARGDDWFVNWADFPSVVPVTDTLWAAHWLARQQAGGYAYDVRVSLSTDAGRTWQQPFTPHTDNTPTEHGFVSLFPWEGGVGAVWLDGRNMGGEVATADDGHGHVAGGMTLRSAVVHRDGRLSHDFTVDALTCDCCQTDVAEGSDGPVVVYRDRTDEEIRDIFVARAVDGAWLEPVPLAADGWRIDGCPVNGPAIAAVGAQVAVAWFTAADDRPSVRVARSADGGRTFSGPIEVEAEGPLGRVDVAILENGDVVVSWLRPEQEGAAIALRRVAVDGRLGPVRVAARTTAGRPSGFPQMVESDGRLVLSWTEVDEAGSRVRSARVDAAAL